MQTHDDETTRSRQRPRTMTRPVVWSMVLAGIAYPVATLAQSAPRATVVQVPPEPPALEQVETADPYLPGAPVKIVSPARRATAGGFASIQANVDANGNNVVGDAANEPSLAVDVLAPNRIAVGWRQFDNIASNFRQAGYAYSRDGGRTWSAQNIIESGIFRSDPVLRAGPNGVMYYLSLGINPWPGGPFLIDLFTSHDGGVTWPDKSFAFGGDKQWLAVDLSRAHLYQAWNTAGNQYFPAQFNRSVDGGATWSTPIEYTPGVTPAVRPRVGQNAVGPDGAVYVAGLDAGGSGQHVVVKSVTALNVFVPVVFELVTFLDLGGAFVSRIGPNPAGIVGQYNVAVDHSAGATAGNVYVLCSVDPPGDDPLDVMFARSEDGGATFDPPVRVNDDAAGINAWQWFGTMSVAPNGRIDVVFNDSRNTGLVNHAELFYTSSMDGGVTWTPNQSLSPTFDSFVGWPNQNKLGDYYDMNSDDVGAHLIWAATFNGEQDIYYLRIGDYDCNANGTADTTDVALGAADCNGNGIPDTCEIAAASSDDANTNAMPDECEFARGDSNLDGIVGVVDFLAVLLNWGPCAAPCPYDSDDDGLVGILDFLNVLANWG